MVLVVKFADLVAAPRLEVWIDLFNAGQTAVTGLLPTAESGPFALTPVQYAYWFGRGQELGLGGVGCHFYVEFTVSSIDISRLDQAIASLAARHPMLRTSFNGDGTQCVLDNWQWSGVEVFDCQQLSSKEADQHLIALRDRLSHRCLEVENGVVFDFKATTLIDRTIIHFEVELLVADVLSIRLMLKDLAQAYQQDAPLPLLTNTFADYLKWRSDNRDSNYDQARIYWLDRIERFPEPLSLPLKSDPADLRGARFVRRSLWIEPSDVDELKKAGHSCGITLPILLATAYGLVLSRWSAKLHFFISLPTFDRLQLNDDIATMVADFTNILILEIDFRQCNNFAEACRKQQWCFRESINYSEFSGVEVLRELSRRRGATVETAAVFTSAIGMGELIDKDVRDVLGEPDYMISQTPQVWLDNQAVEHNGGLLINWDSVDQLFYTGVMDAMFDAFKQLLTCFSESKQWQTSLPDLLPETQRIVRRHVNETAAPIPQGLLHSGFLDYAQRQPEQEAVCWEESERWTYGELLQRVQGIAEQLRERQCGIGDRVAITMKKGPMQVASVLAVLACGAVYVPVGVDQPTSRREKICRSASVAMLLVDEDEPLLLNEDFPYLAIGEQFQSDLPVPELGVPQDALAYIIYTSGSTGEPKGVEITHRAALNTLADINQRFGVSAEDKVMAISALDFDLSVYDIFGLLSVGGALVLPGEHQRRDPYAWKQLITDWQVTLWNSVPALLDMLLIVEQADFKPLRLVMLSGDWVGLDLPERLHQRNPDCRFIALGGATEAAIWSNCYEVDQVDEEWSSIPYGYPLANQKFRIADSLGRDCPDWVIGELWIGGEGVALGYRGDEERTLRQFVSWQQQRWYRTGDLGRYWPNGCLEFLGRTDFQVKIRGHRIELGEVEQALRKYPQVDDAAALAVGERQRHLAAVIVSRTDISLDDLSQFISQYLPSYAVPTQFEIIEQIPLTANGKVNRQVLLQQCQARYSQVQSLDKHDQPQGAEEELIARLWSELLGHSTVLRNDHFMSLGGDSLLATRFIELSHQEGFTQVTLADLFTSPILQDLAKVFRCNQLADDKAPGAPVVQIEHNAQNRLQAFTTTEVQRAYWLGRLPEFELGGVSCHYYMEFVSAQLDVPRLEWALNQLIARHDALRTVFPDQSTQQVLANTEPYKIQQHQITGGQAEAVQLREQLSHYVADPTVWPLFQVHVVSDGQQHRLLLGIDNLIMDALSVSIFLSEWNTLYQKQTLAPAPVINFRDCIAAQETLRSRIGAEIEKAEAYWRERMVDFVAISLPLAKSPAKISKPHFNRREHRLNKADWGCLKDQVRAAGATPSAFLASVFSEVLRYWSGQQAVTLNMTVFDRPQNHPDINRVCGDFTTLMLVHYSPAAGTCFLQRLQEFQESIGQALTHTSVPATWVIREMGRERSEVANMPVVFTSTLGMQADAPLDLAFGRYDWGISQTPQVWLDHQVVEHGGELMIHWDSVDELFPDDVIDSMFTAFQIILKQLNGASTWDCPLPDLLPTSQRQQRQLVNDASVPLPQGLLHSGFFRQARQFPDKTALCWNDQHWTYEQLLTRVQGIAALLHTHGCQQGDRIAISLAKGPTQVAATLAVLASAAVYVPVGVEQPLKRRQRIYQDAGVSLVLGDAGMQAAVDCCPCIVVDESIESDRPIVTGATQQSGDLAYIIYTSGSTGEPKGVKISHQAALNTIEDINRRFAITIEDRVFAVSALDFDLSVYDIFGLLSIGASLVLPLEEQRRDPYAWQRLIERWKVTVWNSVPALLDMLITVEDVDLSNLRLVMLSGDWIGLDLPERLQYRNPNCTMVSLGGATEASIWSNYFHIKAVDHHWHSIPYGYPLGNQQFRVVDKEGRDCPDWVAGELWIGGAGVALGYYGDEERTANQFIEIEGQRWYRTGDMGRYWPDGCLEFLGRADLQVKIRGHRIELGEVEAALKEHGGVDDAIVLAVGDGKSYLAGIVKTQTDLSAQELTDFAADYLPTYSLPTQFLFVSALPLTANGKIDRKSLLQQCLTESIGDSEGEPPQGDTEQQIAQLWSELLGVNDIRRHDHFMSLGGDSLLATRFIEQLREQLKLPISLGDFLRAPTIAALAANIDELVGGDFEEGVL